MSMNNTLPHINGRTFLFIEYDKKMIKTLKN